MILFALLTLILITLFIITMIATGVIGATILILFGDVIIFVLIVRWLIKNLNKKRK